MANIKSATKRIRVSERNRLRNRHVRSVLRNQVKRFRAALAAGDAEALTSALSAAHSTIDRSAKKGVIPNRTASRYKSRLAQAVARVQAPGR